MNNNRKLTVLHVEAGRHLYGGALQVKYLVEGLVKKGVRSILLCPENSAVVNAVDERVEVVTIPMRGDLDIGMTRRIMKLIRYYQADIVHAHSRRGADVFAGLAARLGRVPAVLTRRVDNPERPSVLRVKAGLYHKVVSISHGINQVLIDSGIPERKLSVIHSAVDASHYGLQHDMDWFRKEFGIAPGILVVGIAAQLIERKGHRHLVAVMPEIIRCFPRIQVLCFGQGPLQSALEQEVAELNLSQTVRFVGFRNDLHRILPCLDLLVHPADKEGLGVTLLQASAAGVAIIASSAGGIPEVVQDGINGYLIEPGDREQLTRRILELLADEKLRTSFGYAGRDYVLNHFSIESMVESYLKLYRSMLESH